MNEWFHAKVKFLRQMDNGLIKNITEQYLVDSMSFTECEARVLKEQGQGVREVTCQSIARSPIKEVVFYGDTDQWHKVKVQYSLMDEDTEKEKKVTTYLLVNANDAKDAYERTEEHLKTMLVPFRIPKVEESPICEVFQYEKVKTVGADDIVVGGVGSESAFVKQHGWGASPDDEHEEECAMESDSVEFVNSNVEYAVNGQVKGIDIATGKDSSAKVTFEGGTITAIDPTDGQAVAFEMDLRAYLMKIRPYDWVKLTTEIEKVWSDNPKALQFCLAMNGLSHDEQDHVADILSNNAAFEQDQEDNKTDLEERLDAAMKGGGND